MIGKSNELLSVVLHEVRSPINSLIGLIDITMKSKDEKEIEKNLQLMQVLGKYLLNLSNSFLYVQKYFYSNYKNTDMIFSLQEVIGEITQMFEFQANLKKINFLTQQKFETTTNLIGNETILKQIIINLISNSIKYTNEGGNIYFTIDTKNTDNETIIFITITDTGIGMSQEFLKKIYEPFAQESNSLMPCSSGLGMTIVYHLVQILCGKINIKSEKGKGTTFELQIPYKATNSIKQNFDFVNKRILVVDDSDINREIIKDGLESLNCKVDEAKSGLIALEMLQNSPLGYYDLILIDMRMPGISGCETASLIRKLPRKDTYKIPIIAQSSNILNEDIQAVFLSGMNDYIFKPIKLENLFLILDKYTKSSHDL